MGKIGREALLGGVLLTLSACAGHAPVATPRAVNTPLRDLHASYAEYSAEQDFTAGPAQAVTHSPWMTLRIVSQKEGEPLEVELRDLDSGRTYQGKVAVGEAVSFAPELVGTEGLMLSRRDNKAGVATFERRWGGPG